MDKKDFDEIEDQLIKNDQKKEKKLMPVSGKSVFLLKKMIENRHKNQNNN